MEELQSTEALDREILEDARKKAFKVLKSSDDSISGSKTAWEQKLKTGLEKARVNYAEMGKTARREIMARLPMDKRRIRLETIDTFLHEAMKHFLESLDRASLLVILQNELALKASVPGSAGPSGPSGPTGKSSNAAEFSGEGEFRYRGLSQKECSDLASAAFSGVSFRYIEDPLQMIAGAFPALLINFPHVRISVSADAAAETLLQDKRAELAAALLGDLDDLTVDSGTPIMRSLSGNAQERVNAGGRVSASAHGGGNA